MTPPAADATRRCDRLLRRDQGIALSVGAMHKTKKVAMPPMKTSRQSRHGSVTPSPFTWPGASVRLYKSSTMAGLTRHPKRACAHNDVGYRLPTQHLVRRHHGATNILLALSPPGPARSAGARPANLIKTQRLNACDLGLDIDRSPRRFSKTLTPPPPRRPRRSSASPAVHFFAIVPAQAGAKPDYLPSA